MESTILDTPVLSVIIGIRDWEIARLRVAIKSHQDCTISDEVEVVVSDYGSKNHKDIERLAREMGCTYVYTDSEIWSRSRALNTGIVASSGEFILATDADIIFAPKTHAITVDLLRKYPDSLQLKQCRDLPESIGLDDLLGEVNWPALNKLARTRPRWGMGGLAACSRETADRVRGYDERMVVWGAEDNDFGKRVRASGGVLNWITDSDAQIFHVWHPPFLQTHPDAKAIFDVNRGYLFNDNSVIRNLQPGTIYHGRKPMVSVVIASKNRAEFLRASIESVLKQTFREFELIVIDDGSDDGTQKVLRSFSDPRLKHFRNEESVGVGAARNMANARAIGRYIAVHDDDDLMLPERLEQQLGCIEAGVQGSYGGWMDFDEKAKTLNSRPGKEPFNLSSTCFSGSVLLHPTLMAEKRIFDAFPYFSEFKAGSDYNVAFRMAWNGTRLKHCGSFVTLRRIHSHNMTSVSTAVQKASSLVTNSMFLNALPRNVEQALRQESKATKELEINISQETWVQINRFLPEVGLVPMTEGAPRRLADYTKNSGTVLFATVSQGAVHLLKEVREINAKELDDAVLVEVVKFAERQNLGIKMDDVSATMVQIRNNAIGCVLAAKPSYLTIDVGRENSLSKTLDQARFFLPEGEDLIIFSANNRWFVSFEAGPDQRIQVIERKIEISGSGYKICNLEGMPQ